ncbi:DNA polymerase domain-containing protein [Ktedonobacter racemifer]|uniref:DNA-directed DNA polymerase n=1 Tax=Ktedonobacter racemifer DSM 44963 TaxID=485913 RepID=D6TLZ2_KTERA|nr:DNA polymerase domain-containing protein [Ktedonobacter racemifer]EFH86792.1 DNA-directed DNA polymerase [Ktedonobacter racemifer DSM 44963]
MATGETASSTNPETRQSTVVARSPMQDQHATDNSYLFGWDPMPGIVSVWAHRDGRALIWQRVREQESEQVVCLPDRFRPWLFATTLEDLAHLGSNLLPHESVPRTQHAIWFRELDGPPGSYRYLLSSTDGRLLEREILFGASHRLKYQVKSLTETDLEHTYYRVGAVEQYLMSTGRTYFHGMNYENLHRLQFDLETTSLDPRQGRIFLVSIRDSRGFTKILEAPQVGDEPQLIQELCQIIRERDPDVIENHNLFGFDLSFLSRRALVHEIPLAIGRMGPAGYYAILESREETLAVGPEARHRTRYTVAGRELIDTLDAVRRHDFVVRDIPSYSLKEVARYFGIASPQRVYIEGSAIYDTYRQQPEKVRRYALDDVDEVDGLSRQLLGAPFALAAMAPRRYERLASAGPAMGILEPILMRAYLRAGTALPCQADYATNNAGVEPHAGGAVHLFASGVAEHIVKADVASLYPSLMRTFQIGPACDRLGALLKILARLTDLRLAHKEAARLADPTSIEGNHHNATQAAMKILINAAYGYMGAGQMALFADPQAANEVTSRGRAILSQVLRALETRGLLPIEADTDGVYFAVPQTWTDDKERALVAEIGAELPAGIRLEYEGRYRAMLSHEVKNYALLTYDGKLIVRGVALRSSRSEPFGERFLRKALSCTLMGDIPGVRQAFLETVNALRNRQFSAVDVATRVRLSKSPATYRTSRNSHQEPAYEALLNAGRNEWLPGERVRFYKGRGQRRYIWLPEEAAEENTTPQHWRQHQASEKQSSPKQQVRQDYDVEHYVQMLVTSYAARLRKAFAPEDFEQLFSLNQPGLFDLYERPIEEIHPRLERETTSINL